MAKIDSTRLISIGFAIVIILLISLTVIASSRLQELNRKREHFLQHDTAKFEIFQSMRKIVRERTLMVFTISRDTDPFQLDNEFMHFNALAREFIRLRIQISKMQLYPDEKKHFEQARDIIKVTAPLQNKIIADFIDGDVEQANTFIIQDIPLEKKLWQVFDNLLHASQAHLAREAAANERDNRRATISIIILGILAVVISFVVMLRITRHTKKYQQALEKEKEFAETTLSSIGDAVIAVNSEELITFINLAAQKVLECTEREAIGQPLKNVYNVAPESESKKARHLAFEQFMDGPSVSVSRYSVLTLKNGKEYLIEDVVAPMHDSEGYYMGSTIIFRDVTEAREAERQLSWQALHDPLTGLANRLHFETRLNEMHQQACHSKVEHALLIIDLDNFKPVNDTCGHIAGDMLLKEIADTLSHKKRKSDVLARLGGDEFAVLLNDCSVNKAVEIAEDMRQAIYDLVFDWEDRRFTISASIGVSAIDCSCDSSERIIQQADNACYAAKKAGRNQVCEPTE